MMDITNRRQTTTNYPLYRTAWRRMRRRPFQYVLFVLGVALGVAMMVSIDIANGSASRAFQLSADAITGRTTHFIVGGPTGIDESVYQQLRTELGYRLSAPVVEGLSSSPALGDLPYRLVGVDPFAEPPFRSYLGQEGATGGEALTKFLSQPNSILLSAEVAQTYDLALGDVLQLETGGNNQGVQIVGFIEASDDLTQRGIQDLIFADIATAQEILDMRGKLSRIDLIVTSDAELASIESLLPTSTQIEPAASRSNTIQQMTAAFELNLTALSLLALLVGMFLIYNTVTFSVVQRRPLFGILRCLGVTGRQLATLILAEAALLGFIGSLLGVVLGVILGRVMVQLVTQTINDLYFTVTVRDVAIPLPSLLRGVAIGIVAALLASALPALEAMRTPPNATLRRSTLESKVTRVLPWLVAGWLLLGSFGALLLWLEWGGLVIAFTGLFSVLIAFALVTPPVTVLLMRWVTPLGNRLVGALGRMAPRDIIRSLSRTSVAIAALMTAVSVIVGVSIMIGSFRLTVVQWLDQTLQADVYISPPTSNATSVTGTLDPQLLSRAAAWQGIARAITARHVSIFAPELDQVLNVIAVSGDVSRGNRSYLWHEGERSDIWDRLAAGEGVIVSEPLLRRFDWSVPPPPLTLMTDSGPRSLPILAVFYDYTTDQGATLIGDALYRELWNDSAVSTAAFFVEDGVDVDTIVRDMQSAFAATQTVDIRSNQALRQNSIEIFDRTFAITSALRLLATIVAFIGVLSALMSLQLERARELGTLRATGMTRGQLWQLTLMETGLMGSVAGLLAMPTGYVLAWVLIYVINVRSFGWTLNMYLEPGYFLQSLLVAIIAALLAGIYPALRLGNMGVASALRSD